MKNNLKHLFLMSTLVLFSCSTESFVNILCNEKHIELYVNDEYVGRGLIKYNAPKGVEQINISCRDNGLEIYNRNYYIKGKHGDLIEITIPKDYKYSNNRIKKSGM